MRLRMSGGMPVPESETASTTQEPGFAPEMAAASASPRWQPAAVIRRPPPCGMASRAFTQRLSSTWWIWVPSPSTGGRSVWILWESRMDFGKVSAMTLMTSRAMCFTCVGPNLPVAPWTKPRICLTRLAPRLALCSIVSTRSRSPGDVIPSRSIGAATRIGASMLLRSCAIPAASMPMFSSRWTCRNFSSSSFFSVTSLKKLIRARGRPASSLTRVTRESRMSARPSRVWPRISPFQNPQRSTAPRNWPGSSMSWAPSTSSGVRPTASPAVQPSIRAAPWFQSITLSSRPTIMTPSWEFERISFCSRIRASDCLCRVMSSTTPIRSVGRESAGSSGATKTRAQTMEPSFLT